MQKEDTNGLHYLICNKIRMFVLNSSKYLKTNNLVFQERNMKTSTLCRVLLLVHHIVLIVYSAIAVIPKIFQIQDEELLFKFLFFWSFITVWTVVSKKIFPFVTD